MNLEVSSGTSFKKKKYILRYDTEQIMNNGVNI